MMCATPTPAAWVLSGTCLHIILLPTTTEWPREILEEGPHWKWQSSHQLGFLNVSLEATRTIVFGQLLKQVTNFYFCWIIVFWVFCIAVGLRELFILPHCSFITSFHYIQARSYSRVTVALGGEVGDEDGAIQPSSLHSWCSVLFTKTAGVMVESLFQPALLSLLFSFPSPSSLFTWSRGTWRISEVLLSCSIQTSGSVGMCDFNSCQTN